MDYIVLSIFIVPADRTRIARSCDQAALLTPARAYNRQVAPERSVGLPARALRVALAPKSIKQLQMPTLMAARMAVP